MGYGGSGPAQLAPASDILGDVVAALGVCRRLKLLVVTRLAADFWTLPENEDASFPVVGIGASAGGLEAFTQLLKALPADTGMAFVLVQHLAPSHPSAVAEILVEHVYSDALLMFLLKAARPAVYRDHHRPAAPPAPSAPRIAPPQVVDVAARLRELTEG